MTGISIWVESVRFSVARDVAGSAGPAGSGTSRSVLGTEDRLKRSIPGRLYFPYKIAKESRRAEPELAVLRDMVRRGCTAVDIGANRGLYSYALSRIAGRVEAFEPNPTIAAFARKKLGRNVSVHEVALSDREDTATFYLPRKPNGERLHLLGNLGNFHRTAHVDQIEVKVATLDSFQFTDVGFIKIDVEGSEFEVLTGARETIMRDRPNLLIELLIRPDGEALDAISRIESTFGYRSWVMHEGHRKSARATIETMRISIRTHNVYFTPN